MTVVSFTVTEQTIIDHMCDVHGYSRMWQEAQTDSTLTERHTWSHEQNLNQLVKHIHQEA